MITAKVVSLNSGEPAQMEWNGKSVLSSMLRHPIPGPIQVHRDRIEGNTFANSNAHGVAHSVLYAFGISSALSFMKRLGGEKYIPGAVGENVTLDHFEESEVSVGDIFQFGEVIAQATYPRIPCGKVNFRMQHPEGQKAMQECGKSGVYFRILNPGKIQRGDEVKLLEAAKHRFLISDLYRKTVKAEEFTPDEMRLGIANGALPQKLLDKWTADLAKL